MIISTLCKTPVLLTLLLLSLFSDAAAIAENDGRTVFNCAVSASFAGHCVNSSDYFKSDENSAGYLIGSGLTKIQDFEGNESEGVVASDTLQLPLIQVSARRFDVSDEALPNAVIRLNSEKLNAFGNRSAGQLLSLFSGANIRRFGPGAAQTVSVQGFSGSKLLVMWNDVPLNHPMLGLTDFSLYPSILIDEVSVNTSAGSSEYGGHALGGVISLNSYPKNESFQRVRFEAGSFGALSQSAMISDRAGNISFDLALLNRTSENDFTYLDITQNPAVKRQRTNSSNELKSVVGNVRFVSRKYHGSTGVWFTDSFSDIPGPIIAPSTEATQKDQYLRASHQSDVSISEDFVVSGNLSYNFHQLNYFDRNASIESLSKSRSIGGKLYGRYTATQSLQLRSGAGADHSWLHGSEYEAPSVTSQFGYLSAFYSPYRFASITGSIRYNVFNRFENALTYAFGANFIVIDNPVMTDTPLRIFGNFSKNYAPPTFNDLYWPGLGNPDLVPEIAYKVEIGLVHAHENYNIRALLFRNDIENGIQWLPGQDGRFRPNNIQSILSRGIILDGETRFRFSDVDFKARVSYTYLESSIRNSRFPGDNAVGKQMVYQPNHRITSGLTTNYRFLSLFVLHQFTSERFVNEDHAFSLEPFFTIDAGLTGRFQLRNYDFKLSTAIENITDEAYSYVRWYPMPGRMYHITLTIQRNQKS